MALSVNNMMSSVVYGKKTETLKKELKSELKAEPNTEQVKNPSALGGAGTVYADDKERKENEDMLRKMQMSGTKLESLGVYFGAMQEALIDSGSDGIMAHRRTGNLIKNGTDYMSTSEYEEKEESKCLVKDLTESLKESQEALKEKQSEKKESDKKLVKEEQAAKDTGEASKPSKGDDSIKEDLSASNLSKEPEISVNNKNSEKAEVNLIKEARINVLGSTVDIAL